MTRACRRLALVGVAALLAARPLSADDPQAAGPTVRTWAEVLAWLEAEGVHAVTIPSLSGPLKQAFRVDRQAGIFAALDVLAHGEGIHFGAVATDLVVLRPHFKLRTGCPQHLTAVEEAEVASLRLLASLSDDQWRRLACEPIPVAELRAESQAPLRAFLGASGTRYPSSCDGMLLIVTYMPWVTISDGRYELCVPLRCSEDAWYPELRVRPEGMEYRGVAHALLARPAIGPFLAPPLEAPDPITVEREEWTLGELTGSLSPDAIVGADVSERLILVPPGRYRAGLLLQSALEATGCVLKEFDRLQTVPYYISQAPGSGPPEPVWPVEERAARAVSAIAALIEPAYAPAIQAETGAPAGGMPKPLWPTTNPRLREYLAGLMATYTSMLSVEEAAWRAPALTEASAEVRSGLLVGLAEYDADGGWVRGYHVLVRTSACGAAAAAAA